jgi:hypothetical protein
LPELDSQVVQFSANVTLRAWLAVIELRPCMILKEAEATKRKLFRANHNYEFSEV